MNKNDITVVAGDESVYLRYLPKHLHAAFLEGLNDPQITNLRRQIALNETRIKSLLLTLDREVLSEDEISEQLKVQFPNLDPALYPQLAAFVSSFLPENFVDHRTFKRLESLVDRYEKAMLNRTVREADQALRQLFDMIRKGTASGSVWQEVSNALDQQRKLAEAEEYRSNQVQKTMTLDKVVMLMGYTIHALKEGVNLYVQDPEIRSYVLEYTERVYAAQFAPGNDPQSNQIAMDE